MDTIKGAISRLRSRVRAAEREYVSACERFFNAASAESRSAAEDDMFYYAGEMRAYRDSLSVLEQAMLEEIVIKSPKGKGE